MDEFRTEFHDRFDDVASPTDVTNTTEGAEAIDETAADQVDQQLLERLEQIHEYRVDIRPESPASRAAMRGISADLMEREVHLAAAFRQATGSEPMALEDIQENPEAINLMIRLAKQITQMRQLEMRTAKLQP